MTPLKVEATFYNIFLAPQKGMRNEGAYCKVGNTATDEEDTALGVNRSTQHEVKNGTSIEIGLSLSGSTRVLSVVGQFTGETRRSDGVRVHNRSTTTSDEGPHSANGVKDSKLKRSTGLSIERCDITDSEVNITARS